MLQNVIKQYFYLGHLSITNTRYGVIGRDKENQLFIILDGYGPENRGKLFIFQHKNK